MNGILPLLKPPGWTSQQAVTFVKKLYRVRAGHAGTLDPDAAGVLPVCLGTATRLAQYLMETPKAYRFTACFGVATDTQDAAGRVTDVGDAAGLDPAAVLAAMGRFRGEIEQVPPMFSAVKREGQPLYKLARQGEVVERQPRRVTIHAFDLLDWVAGERPRAMFDVRCSRGTYIRTLIDDLGRALGTAAHLTALLRRQAGGIDVADARTPQELSGAPAGVVVPPAEALSFLPGLDLSPREADGVRRGLAPAPRPGLPCGAVRLLDPVGRLAGMGRVEATGDLHLERVLA